MALLLLLLPAPVCPAAHDVRVNEQWWPLTIALLDILSLSTCLSYVWSICPSMLPSMILHRTRRALARKRLLFTSLVRLLVTIITSSAAVASTTSLMNKYIIRLSIGAWDWNKRVTPKTFCLGEVSVSPCTKRYNSLVNSSQHSPFADEVCVVELYTLAKQRLF